VKFTPLVTTKNKLSMGLDLKDARGLELLMALWKISDVWMESSAPGTMERCGLSNELALAINPSLVIVRVSTYGQFGKEDYLGRPGYDALAQAYGGMMNITGDPSGPPQRAKGLHGGLLDSADRMGLHNDGPVGSQENGQRTSHRFGPV
jgi:crotonobetainyl-CoA:carnitine CoA-transferase CaiB-like acyl-CoA transferase